MKRLYKSAADADCGCEVPEEQKDCSRPRIASNSIHTLCEKKQSPLRSPHNLEQGAGLERTAAHPYIKKQEGSCQLTSAKGRLLSSKPAFVYIQQKVITQDQTAPNNQFLPSSNSKILPAKYNDHQIRQQLSVMPKLKVGKRYLLCGKDGGRPELSPLERSSTVQATLSSKANCNLTTVLPSRDDSGLPLSSNSMQSTNSLLFDLDQSLIVPPPQADKSTQYFLCSSGLSPPDDIVVMVVPGLLEDKGPPPRKYPKERYTKYTLTLGADLTE